MNIVIKEELDLGVYDEGANSQNLESTGAHYGYDVEVARNVGDPDIDNLMEVDIIVDENREGFELRGASCIGDLNVPGYSWTPSIEVENRELSDGNDEWCDVPTDNDESDYDSAEESAFKSPDRQVTFNISNLLNGEIPRRWNPRVVLERLDKQPYRRRASIGGLDAEANNGKVGEVQEDCYCKFCEKYLTDKLSLKEHMRIHKPFSCELCDKTYTQKSHLNFHLKTHVQKPFCCELCDEAFTRISHLNVHLKIHSDVKRCHICKKTFAQKYNLIRHLKRHSGGIQDALKKSPSKPYFDSVKNSKLIHNSIVKDHFDCDHCSRSFSTNSLLKQHIKKHACCKDCGMQFVSRVAMMTHIRTISCGKHCCEMCGRGFSHNYNLKRHLKTHHSSKIHDGLGSQGGSSEESIDIEAVRGQSYACKACGVEFHDGKFLEIHFRTCRAENNSSIMEESSGIKSATALSKQKHESKRPIRFFCKICKKGFKWKYLWRTHLTKHNIQITEESSELEKLLLEETAEDSKNSSSAKESSEFEKQLLEDSSEQSEDTEETNHFCKVCSKGFRKRQSLLKHAKRHKSCNVKKTFNSIGRGIVEKRKELDKKAFHSSGLNLNATGIASSNGETKSPLHKILNILRPIPDKKKHACQNCGEIFTLRSRLAQHMRQHFCQEIKGKVSRLKNDVKAHSDSVRQSSIDEPHLPANKNFGNAVRVSNKLSCQFCPRQFSTSNSLARHSKLHQRINSYGPAKPYVCKTCGRSYNFMHLLKRHRKIHDSEINGSDQQSEMIKYVPPLRIKKPFSCRLCDKRFLTSSLLRSHAKTHLKCGRCGFLCSGYQFLRLHSKKHPGYLPFACKSCFKRFSTLSSLYTHMNLHIKVAKSLKPHLCETCGRGFDAKHLLLRHIRVHETEHVEIPKGTPEREKAFISDDDVSQITPHTEIAPREAKEPDDVSKKPELGKPFNKKKFCCDRCDKKFVTVSLLVGHKKIHLKCSVCGLQCTSLFFLAQHAKKHPNYRPFVCKFCHKGFPRPDSLRNHMQLHEKVVPSKGQHACKVCGRGYELWRALATHSRAIHNIKLINPKTIMNTEKRNTPSDSSQHFDNDSVSLMIKSEVEQNVAKPKSFKIHSEIRNSPNKTSKYFRDDDGDDDDNVSLLMNFEVKRNVSDNENVYFCRVCDQGFTTVSSLKRHVELHKKVKLNNRYPFHCTVCRRGFDFKAALILHSRVHENEKFGFHKSKKLVESTIAKYVPPLRTKKPFGCKKCPKSFFTSSLLSIHSRAHLKHIKSGKPSLQKGSLDRHKNKQSCFCQFCELPFNKISDLYSHIITIHRIPNPSPFIVLVTENEGTPFSCQICNKTFSTKRSLELHGKIHDRESFNVSEDPLIESSSSSNETFDCERCGKSYNKKSEYVAHLRIHKKTTFSCKECDETFKTQLLLRSHAKTHVMSKPHKCQTCGETFLAAASLTVHKLMHSQVEQDSEESNVDKEDAFPHKDDLVDVDTKPFVCKLCSVCFTHEFDYEQHLKTHETAKDLESKFRVRGKKLCCGYCEQRFRFESTLQMHLRTHADGRDQIKCSLCRKCFPGRISLANHMRVHKKQNKSEQFSPKNRKYSHLEGGSDGFSSESVVKFSRNSTGSQEANDYSFYSQEQDVVAGESNFEPQGTETAKRKVICSISSVNGSKILGNINNSVDISGLHSTEQQDVISSNLQGSMDSQDKNTSGASTCSSEGTLKPYACCECGKRFKCESNLKIHMLTFPHATKEADSLLSCDVPISDLEAQSENTYNRSHELVAAGNVTEGQLLIKPSVSHLQEMFKCPKCDKSFYSKRSLIDHSLTHNSQGSSGLPADNQEKDIEDPKRCPICKKKFSSKSARMDHMVLHDGTKPFQCSHCDERFRFRSARLQHILVAHSDLYENSSNTGSDRAGVTEGDASSCKPCGKSFDSNANLHKHLVTEHSKTVKCETDNAKPFPCLLCSQRYALESGLKNHLMAHVNDAVLRPYPCKKCGRRFRAEGALVSHLQHASSFCAGEQRSEVVELYRTLAKLASDSELSLLKDFDSSVSYKCRYCDDCFALKSARRDHILLVHPGKNFTSASSEQRRLLKAGKQLMYCRLCRAKFTSKPKLLQHTTKMHGHKSVFSSKFDVSNRQNVRNDKRLRKNPFACLLCTRTYAKESFLISHLQTHSNDAVTRPYPCSQCGRRFKDLRGLDFHVKFNKFHCDGGKQRSEVLELYGKLGNTESGGDQCIKIEQTSDTEINSKNDTGVEKTCDFDKAVETVYSCSSCDERFFLRSSRYNHVLKEHPSVNPNAEDATFYEVDLTLDDQEVLASPLCIKTCEAESPLKAHTASKRDHRPKNSVSDNTIRPLICLLCTGVVSFKAEKGFQNHIRKHAKDLVEKPYVCNQCCRRYKTLTGLRKHTEIWDCDEENREQRYDIYISLTDLATAIMNKESVADTDIREDNKDKPHPCNRCDQKLPNRSAYRSHILLVHHNIATNPDGVNDDADDASKNQLLKCLYCDEVFATKRRRACHMISVHNLVGNKPETQHEKKFRPLPPLVCRICLARFTYETDLESHLLTHANDAVERPYSCNQCERRFKVKRTLETHEISHTSGGFLKLVKKSNNRYSAPYQCRICIKRFTQEAFLARHLTTHENDSIERPYSCNKCERRFTTRTGYEAHLRMLHNRQGVRIGKKSDNGVNVHNSEGQASQDNGENIDSLPKPAVCLQERIVSDKTEDRNRRDVQGSPFSGLLCESDANAIPERETRPDQSILEPFPAERSEPNILGLRISGVFSGVIVETLSESANGTEQKSLGPSVFDKSANENENYIVSESGVSNLLDERDGADMVIGTLPNSGLEPCISDKSSNTNEEQGIPVPCLFDSLGRGGVAVETLVRSLEQGMLNPVSSAKGNEQTMLPCPSGLLREIETADMIVEPLFESSSQSGKDMREPRICDRSEIGSEEHMLVPRVSCLPGESATCATIVETEPEQSVSICKQNSPGQCVSPMVVETMPESTTESEQKQPCVSEKWSNTNQEQERPVPCLFDSFGRGGMTVETLSVSGLEQGIFDPVYSASGNEQTMLEPCPSSFLGEIDTADMVVEPLSESASKSGQNLREPCIYDRSKNEREKHKMLDPRVSRLPGESTTCATIVETEPKQSAIICEQNLTGQCLSPVVFGSMLESTTAQGHAQCILEPCISDKSAKRCERSSPNTFASPTVFETMPESTSGVHQEQFVLEPCIYDKTAYRSEQNSTGSCAGAMIVETLPMGAAEPEERAQKPSIPDKTAHRFEQNSQDMCIPSTIGKDCMDIEKVKTSSEFVNRTVSSVQEPYDSDTSKERNMSEKLALSSKCSNKEACVVDDDAEVPNFTKAHNQPVKCPTCCRLFKSNKSLTGHMRVHSTNEASAKERSYKCSICTNKYAYASSLKIHMRNHEGEVRPYQCQKCKKRFKVLWWLAYHLKTENCTGGQAINTVEAIESSAKSIPGRSQSKSEGNVTENTTGGDKNVVGKDLLTKCDSREGLTLVDKHKCQLCKKEFETEGELNLHTKKIHKRKRTLPFQCNWCRQRYKFEESLQKHLLTHSNDASKKPYKCQKCHMRYKSIRGLSDHFRIHTIEDERVIDSTKDDIAKPASSGGHLAVANDEDLPHKCPHCSKRFKFEKTLSYHSVKHASDVELGESALDLSTNGMADKRPTEDVINVGTNSEQFGGNKKVMKDADNQSIAVLKTQTLKNQRRCYCPYCRSCFKHRKNFNFHLLLTHMNTKSTDSVGDHLEGGNDDSVIKCRHCGKIFKAEKSLTAHLLNVLSKQPSGAENSSSASIVSGNTELQITDVKSTESSRADSKPSAVKPYKCSTCFKRFRIAENLRRHVVKVHRSVKLTCPYCRKSFKDVQRFYFHLNVAHSVVSNSLNRNSEGWQCPCCSSSFKLEDQFASHLLHCVPENSSDILKTNSKNPKPVTGNQVGPIGSKRADMLFSCKHCLKRFKEKQSLAVHVSRTHTDLESYLCPVCGRHFKMRHHLERHVTNVHKNAIINCPHCPMRFKDSKLFNLHLRSHGVNGEHTSGSLQKTDVNEKVEDGSWYSCQYCSQRFLFEKNYKSHVSSHFIDESSGMADPPKIISKKRLRTSSVGETSPRKATKTSSICGVSAKNVATAEKKSPANKIVKTPGRKPNNIVSTMKATKNNDENPDLKNKEPDAPLYCENCGKCCKNRSSLEIHLRTHTGERPYPCRHCGKTFTQVSSRNLHERKVHNEIECCPHCSATFQNKNDFKIHLKIFHSNDDDAIEQPVTDHSKNAEKKYIKSESLPLSCPHCHKSFRYKKRFDEHLLKHKSGTPGRPINMGKRKSSSFPLQTHHGFKESDLTSAGADTETVTTELPVERRQSLTSPLLKRENAPKEPINVQASKDSVESPDDERDFVSILPYGCPHCSKRFKFETSLKAHLPKHGARQKSFTAVESSRQSPDNEDWLELESNGSDQSLDFDKTGPNPNDFADGSVFLETNFDTDALNNDQSLCHNYSNELEDPLCLLPNSVENNIDQFD